MENDFWILEELEEEGKLLLTRKSSPPISMKLEREAFLSLASLIDEVKRRG